MRQATWCPVHDSSTSPLSSSTTTWTSCSSSAKKPTSQSRSLSAWFAEGAGPGARASPRSRSASPLGDADRLLLADRRLVLRARGGPCGAERAPRRRRDAGSAPAALAPPGGGAGYANVHILLPMKLNGIAKATAIACAGSSATSAAWISSSSDDQVDPQRQDADREEARRLKAGVAVLGVEGPVPVPEEVVGDGDAEGDDRRRDVVDPEAVAALPEEEPAAGQDREDGQVDDVARGADQPELEQLHPVLRAAWCRGRSASRSRRGSSRATSRSPTPKCPRMTGARSRSAHWGLRAGRLGPQPTNSSGASESSRLRAPWLPPPTWLTPPQSTHS